MILASELKITLLPGLAHFEWESLQEYVAQALVNYSINFSKVPS